MTNLKKFKVYTNDLPTDLIYECEAGTKREAVLKAVTEWKDQYPRGIVTRTRTEPFPTIICVENPGTVDVWATAWMAK